MPDAVNPSLEKLHFGDFASAVVQLLDEFAAADFRNAERILDALQRQGRTISGYPRIRASDCDRVTSAIRAIFDANRQSFVTRDDTVVRRFDAILDAFARTDIRFYPRELMRARLLQAEAKLLLNDPVGARRLIGHFADRPYKVEGDPGDIATLMRLDCRARAIGADTDGLGDLAKRRALMLTRITPFRSRAIVSDLVEFISLGTRPDFGHGVLTRLLHDASSVVTRVRSGAGTSLRRLWRAQVAWIFVGLASLLLSLLRYGDIRWRRDKSKAVRARNKDIIVTRAMGGIGDLFMMTPGLHALAKRYSTKVTLVIDRKYFGIFENNPDVELVDIDGPPADIANCRSWFNLTFCPAGRYEARTRPFVKKGRVELFAEGMGIGKRRLSRSGGRIVSVLSEKQKAFRDAYVTRAGFSGRPIVGVQPYSRDSYKDHPNITAFIAALSDRFDVILFHHSDDGLPHGKGISSTVGLSLGQSIALVSALDVMVCIDSGFLHAAAAFDVPAVALFGPTDGRLFTRHHPSATVLSANAHFPCAPCWRNEDLPCQITGQFGPGPCVASLSFTAVQSAVDAAIEKRAAQRHKEGVAC